MPNALQDHPIAWVPPSPFWFDTNGDEMQRPAILRFASDEFMDDLQRLLASDPEKLRALLAVPETWRGLRVPARTPNPAGGQAGLLGRWGVAKRRAVAQRTERPQRSSDAIGMDLKLYQPAHLRYYLVGAALVCQQPGLPDRRIDKGKAEQTSFVIRRWFPPEGGLKDDNLPEFNELTWTEHAWVAPASGGAVWQAVANSGSADERRRVVLPEEERLPLFPMNYAEDSQRSRRMLAGLIPVGKREAYLAAARKSALGASAGGGATTGTGALVLFRKTISEPWKALVDRAAIFRRGTYMNQFGNAQAVELDSLLRFRADVQISSWLLLADLRKFMETYVTRVWERVVATTTTPTPVSSPGSLGGDRLALYNALLETRFERFATATPPAPLTRPIIERVQPAARRKVATCLADALKLLTQDALDSMERAENSFAHNRDSIGWPDFLFPLVETDDPKLNDTLAGTTSAPFFGNSAIPIISPAPVLSNDERAAADFTNPPISNPPANIFERLAKAVADFKQAIDQFVVLVVRSIDPAPDAPVPPVPTAAERPADPRPGWFMIRCVYERPGCGKLHQDVVSTPTQRFQLAGFFDPDAPARPIRIGLPIDTTPAGLRKFDKNTAFVMSDVLCGQVARLRGLTFGDLVLSVLPFPFHKDLSVPEGGPCQSSGVNVGLICSLSIPIITLCALVLLMIMVSLLDLVFRWMPYFIVCFPLPGLRAKPK